MTNVMLYLAGQRLYFEYYSDLSLNYTSYLIADSHGLPLNTFTNKYGVYNFSAGGDSYFDIYRKIIFIINNTKVDTIYITVDDHTLSPYREENNNSDRSVIYSLPSEYSSSYEYLKDRYLRYYIVLLQPKVRSVFKSFIISKIKTIINSEKQDTWESLTIPDRIKRSESRAKYQFSYANPSIKLEKSLLDIITICKQNNIELIGLKFPVTYEYIKILDNKNYNADNLLKSNGFKVFDFSRLFLKNSDYFYDQDHLNDVGGKKFVELLFANLRK